MSSRRMALALVLAGLTGAASSWLVRQPPARAQTRFAECAALSIPHASNGERQHGGVPENPIRMPQGWTPVGGGQYRDTIPVVIVCR